MGVQGGWPSWQVKGRAIAGRWGSAPQARRSRASETHRKIKRGQANTGIVKIHIRPSRLEKKSSGLNISDISNFYNRLNPQKCKGVTCMKKTHNNQFSVKKLLSCLLLFGMLTVMAACGESKGTVSSDNANLEIKGIVGTWNEVSVYPRVLTVKEDGTYTLDEDGGTVKVDLEEHPDGSQSVWYTFTTNEGEFWASFAKDEENDVQNDLWSGQDGEFHFMRDGIDEHLTADNYFLHTWSSGRCYIVFEKKKNSYIATVTWSSSASESTQWTYNCKFDKASSSMICKKGATRTEVSFSESGKEKIKVVYKDGSGSFIIKSGTLRWTDDKEDSGNDMYFVQIDEAE